MNEQLLVSLAGIVVLGIGAQWLAWRLRLPAIIPLLAAGFIAGPITGWLDPSAIFGDVLLPVVSIGVGLILFEGGMSLRINELRAIGPALRGVLTIGPLVTWFATAAAAHYLVGLSWSLGLLLGAICIVTGPTVIGPMLRQIRPTGAAGALLKWEGILTDPLGAAIALLVFEAIEAHGAGSVTWSSITGMSLTLATGAALGLGGGWALTQLLRLYWIPDYLQNAVTVMFIVAALTLSNLIQHESGLLTVTLMGIYLANQRSADVHHIIEFKENIRVLIIAALFIVLTASLDADDLRALPLATIFFVVAMFLVVRPLAIFGSTAFSKLEMRDKVFLSWVAPRGIVAASVSAVFGLRLTESGVEGAELLAPLTYVVIAATVTVYGLTAGPLAYRLGLARPNQTGMLIVGAHRLARALAVALRDDVRVLLADTNYGLVNAARREKLEVYHGNALSDQAEDEMDLTGLGAVLALTPNDEVNSIACLRFGELFGRARVFQYAAAPDAPGRKQAVTQRLRGRSLFSAQHAHDQLMDLLRKGGEVRRFELTEDYPLEKFKKGFGNRALALILVQDGMPKPFTVIDPPKPKTGDTLICLVMPQGMVAVEEPEADDEE